jgi:hypothetical protein
MGLNLSADEYRGLQEAVSLKGVASFSFQRGVAGPERWISVKVQAVTVYKTKLGCFYFHSEYDVAIRLVRFVTRQEFCTKCEYVPFLMLQTVFFTTGVYQCRFRLVL